ncbi:MAG: o-succinylbenzoate synthase, partial [Bacteroidota bacterium]
MLNARFKRYDLVFKRPAGTSRGVLNTKETWFLEIRDGHRWGIGECGILRGLSCDDRPDYEEKLAWTCAHIEQGEAYLYEQLKEFPSIQIGLETAFRSLEAEHPFSIFPSAFTEGQQAIAINGLIWMGDKAFMKQQIVEKIEQGFDCIKMKIGAIDFEAELDLLAYIRREFTPEAIELRVDANGAFAPSQALERLKRLSEFDLHSIEQPIKQGQWQEMATLCDATPVPIALDEELIGVFDSEEKQQLITNIQPQYIILKPSFIGGFRGTDEWISKAENQGVGWWVTSALESNIGLNAIS